MSSGSGLGALGIPPRVTRDALGWRRQAAGFAVALIGGPLLTWMLFLLRSPESITAEVLWYQLLVVVVALIGGLFPAVFAAVLSGLTLDLLFVAPQFSITVAHPLQAVALALYVVIAVLVGLIVSVAARRGRAAVRATAEAELLVSVAGNVLRGEHAVQALISRAREAFGLSGVRLVSRSGEVIAADGEPVRDGRFTSVDVGRDAHGAPEAVLELHGVPIDAPARRLLEVIVAQLGAAIEHTDLSASAQRAEALAETDQVRSALLSALSHDLRRPLASAMAAVGGLRAAHGLSPADRDELLATADESLATLSTLITDLLDVSRVEAGVLAVSLSDTDAENTVLAALDELGLPPSEVELQLDPTLAPLRADPVLLQRVIVNLLANAHRHAPEGRPVVVSTARRGGYGEIRIIDHGLGVPAVKQERMFAPFQRLGDTDNNTGLGLGLALSKGFTEGMSGTLIPEQTPGGGLTMVVSLPLAAAPSSRSASRGEDTE
jgi:two-component system sensor histidine kinase KdpD